MGPSDPGAGANASKGLPASLVDLGRPALALFDPSADRARAAHAAARFEAGPWARGVKGKGETARGGGGGGGEGGPQLGVEERQVSGKAETPSPPPAFRGRATAVPHPAPEDGRLWVVARATWAAANSAGPTASGWELVDPGTNRIAKQGNPAAAFQAALKQSKAFRVALAAAGGEAFPHRRPGATLTALSER